MNQDEEHLRQLLKDAETPRTNIASDPGNGAGEPRFQFSIRQMLLLTAVSALAAGVAGWLGGSSTVCRIVLVCYLILMAAYLVLRLPFVCRQIMGLQTRWEQIRVHRKELEAMIRERRNKRG